YSSPILRCQLHKRRNVCDHFAAEDQPGWDRKLANAYDLRSYREAKAALLRIHHELNHINPSAGRSLEEGMEETLTLHRLQVPIELWKTLRSTNCAPTPQTNATTERKTSFVMAKPPSRVTVRSQ